MSCGVGGAERFKLGKTEWEWEVDSSFIEEAEEGAGERHGEVGGRVVDDAGVYVPKKLAPCELP